MFFDNVITILNQTLYMVMAAVLIFILPGLLIGLIVAVFQAATQVNEMTLSFLPKFILTVFVIAWLSPWWLSRLITFFRELVHDIPHFLG